MTDSDSPITQEDATRFLREILTAAGPAGLPQDEIEEALGEFIDMNITAAAVSLWHDGKITMGWSDGQMIWGLTGGTA
ncbi:hypothetical protein [Mycolicibacterium fortuitum]|uniref:Uncharacterized protein n=2 Tax=Mycolicibacterium fortuitum TaxID=1766 RepID=A0A0N9YD56_MYCFO|nr:hypothetical protein [Mycolicibacterium fortuitum]ALI24938.1 hypothetical protein XA26_10810 [Mycolicibacterium fortuitum]MCV7138576.1 hypothetical protein [Mycolicibacterium fortuitum]MDV7195759.1 hypothetical protein [Mycolicibacterium fortuitum]MDV7208664.1 hypothetical protein [Mycolicibacterium fortuitum]MDV7230561.1 hypothetical protein [Mycolicibacterium fortuitum]